MDQIEILLVDDNENDAELTIRSLRKNCNNCHLLYLKDGADALEFLFGTGQFTGRDTSRKPKVILLDLKMPKVNGIEVLQKIKANVLTMKIPVVVLTSSNKTRIYNDAMIWV